MPNLRCLFSLLGIILWVSVAHAEQALLTGLTYSTQANAERLSFQLSNGARQHYSLLNNPYRLVVDFENTRLSQNLPQPENNSLFTQVRSGVRDGVNLRVVVHLKTDALVKANLNNQSGAAEWTFEVSAKAPAPAAEAPTAEIKPPAQVKDNLELALNNKTLTAPVPVKSNKIKGRDIIVAIDAGHGGKDVGAQGSNGTQEKDVVFAIARRLQALIDNQPGMRAVMIRDGDYFVYLNERVRLAQQAKADLLVSIHADSFLDASAHGASVYTLAKKGASSAGAKWLADSENKADGDDASSSGHSGILANVLQDLSNKAAKEASQNVGVHVLRQVKALSGLHRNNVQKAGFAVLKSADIPSILVETAFISNPTEELRLSNRAYQDKMASALFSGIMAHFRQYAPANTLFAQQSKSAKNLKLAKVSAYEPTPMLPVNDEKPIAASASAGEQQHVISSGETLMGIAMQYKISMRALRLANNMPDGQLKVGQVLRIPQLGRGI